MPYTQKIPECAALSIGGNRSINAFSFEMKGFQKAYLRALGKTLEPTVIVGKGGLTPEVMGEVHRSFERQELIKVKFTSFKLKDEKDEMAESIALQTDSFMAGMVGHTALFYKQAVEARARRIRLPADPAGELVTMGGGSKVLQRVAGK